MRFQIREFLLCSLLLFIETVTGKPVTDNLNGDVEHTLFEELQPNNSAIYGFAIRTDYSEPEVLENISQEPILEAASFNEVIPTEPPSTPKTTSASSKPNSLYSKVKSINGYAQTYLNFIPILKLFHKIQPDVAQYDFAFETGNGIRQQESGYLKPLTTYGHAYGYENRPKYSYDADLATVKTGSASWTSPEGLPFSFSYIADEFGYRAYGAHIYPTASESKQHQTSDSYNNPTDFTTTGQHGGIFNIQVLI